MKIRTDEVHPSLVIGDDIWTAIDDDTYDGAPDSSNRNMIGYGKTEQEAIDDLMRLMQERAECEEEDRDALHNLGRSRLPRNDGGGVVTPADKARELAIPVELKKHGLRQQQSGEWVISFTVHPNDMAAAISLAPMGTRYQAALVELSDDGQATERQVMPDRTDRESGIPTSDTAPVREQEPARAHDATPEPCSYCGADWLSDHDQLCKRPRRMEAEPPKRRLEQPRTPCRWDEMTMAAQAGMLAQDASFQRYLSETIFGLEYTTDEAVAARYIRKKCAVASRREIEPTNEAGKIWLGIVKQYRVWELLPRVGA